MKFLSIRDLRSKTAQLRKDLKADSEIVVTANGRPFALMTRVEPDKLEREITAIRQARAQAAVSRMRADAKAAGLDRMPADEINAIIARTRRERRVRK
jgi:antitoxin (DNA-binding transcriptional repressor) of toxin-antitoxin stability system